MASARIAREALDQFFDAQGDARPTGRPSPQTLDYVPLAAGADALKDAVDRGRGGAGRRDAGACTT